ncbi:hypothetical protein LXL04_012141 [Taraxacum kok-saghyz]
MSNRDPDLMNVPPDLHHPDRDIFFSPNSEIGDFSDHSGIVPANWGAIPLPSHSPSTHDHTMEDIDPALQEPKLHSEIATSGNTNSNHQLIDNTAFVSTLHNDTFNILSNLTKKLENAKLSSPVPLNIENPITMKTDQNQKNRNKICSDWMKLDLKQKVRLVNKLGASKNRMAPKKSIWIKRVKNLARKKHLNLDNTLKRNKTINLHVEKLSEAEENQLKKASDGTIDKNKPENNIVADKEKKEERNNVEQVPMSYADKVGKKRQMANLFSVIIKDPKLKVGEVEMPIADILNGKRAI